VDSQKDASGENYVFADQIVVEKRGQGNQDGLVSFGMDDSDVIVQKVSRGTASSEPTISFFLDYDKYNARSKFDKLNIGYDGDPDFHGIPRKIEKLLNESELLTNLHNRSEVDVL